MLHNFILKDVFIPKKVIIWGHKLSDHHTHSYIHSSYYKAFRAVGFESYWLDDGDAEAVAGQDFKDCIFFTEGQVSNKIPLVKDAIYILHHCDNTKYLEAGGIVLNLCNYLKYCEQGISFNYKGNSVEKIDNLVFYDQKARALYQPWATDLLPHEINQILPCMYDENKKVVNYVGSIWSENYNQIMPFIQACKDNQKEFKHYYGGILDIDNKRLIRESYIAPDIRGDWHIECGYLPCRIFKNISYGQVSGTNSEHVKKVFGDIIAYNPDNYGLFKSCVEKAKDSTYEQIKESMRWIRDNHTYINRVNAIFYTLGNL